MREMLGVVCGSGARRAARRSGRAGAEIERGARVGGPPSPRHGELQHVGSMADQGVFPDSPIASAHCWKQRLVSLAGRLSAAAPGGCCATEAATGAARIASALEFKMTRAAERQ